MPTESVVLSARRTGWKIGMILVGAVLLVVVSVASVNAWNAGVALNIRFAVIPDALPAGETADTGGAAGAAGAQNILVLGVDGAEATGGGRVADDPTANLQADALVTVMLVNITAARDRVAVLTIPPGTPIELPVMGSATLAEALTSGGVATVVDGVQGLVDSRIHHVAAVDVTALGVAADVLGGVRVDATPGGGPVDVAPGDGARLSGTQVRALLRAPDGAQTAPAVVRSVLLAARDAGTFRSLRQTGALATRLAPFIAVDRDLTIGYLSSLRLELRDIGSDVAFGTIDAAASSSDAPAVDDAARAIRTDTLADYLDGFTAGN
jgi:hypothetical protein